MSDSQHDYYILYEQAHAENIKLTRQRDTLKKALDLVVYDAAKPIEEMDSYFIGEETLIECKEALQDVEAS